MSRSPSAAEPLSGSCKVASVRISVDFPAPFGPSRPYMPRGMLSETWSRALTPFGYVFDRPLIFNSICGSAVQYESKEQRVPSLPRLAQKLALGPCDPRAKSRVLRTPNPLHLIKGKRWLG